MTTEIEYEEMKQKNFSLQEENAMLKKSLEELIKINNQLTDSIEEYNNKTVKLANTHSHEEEIDNLKEEISFLNSKLHEYHEGITDTEN